MFAPPTAIYTHSPSLSITLDVHHIYILIIFVHKSNGQNTTEDAISKLKSNFWAFVGIFVKFSPTSKIGATLKVS